MESRIKSIFFLFAFVFALVVNTSAEETSHPDTVKVGVYVTSVHDVDFKQKEYSINMWLWFKYKRPEFDFMKNLEVPMAKTFEKSYATLDTLDDGTIYLLMKLQCVMKGTWKINYYPFDHQRLRFSIENSNFDSKSLVFSKDTFGRHYGKYFLMGWEKDSFKIQTDVAKYETGFGDPSLTKPYSEYAAYKVTVMVHRSSWELFGKLFLGMYIAFLIALVCFFIHPDYMDSRLALSVGALFAVIGNKYIIDSTLPESNSFTLVDWLHGVTLFYIFLTVSSSVFTLNYIKKNGIEKGQRYNNIIGVLLSLLYVAVNIWLIYRAYYSEAIG